MTDTDRLAAARADYLRYVNDILPSEIKSPVRFNHCFARIVLDWLFQDEWYRHITDRPAYKALDADQLRRALERMETWREDRDLLIADNRDSLRYRGKLK